MLSKEIQQRNIRKVRINAQITFVIYVLELVGSYAIFLLWILLTSFVPVFHEGYNVVQTLSILWYHVILPYTLLMNTSHNKDLVIDDGWETTIRNTLTLPTPLNMMTLESISQLCQRFHRSRENIVEPFEETNSRNVDTSNANQI